MATKSPHKVETLTQVYRTSDGEIYGNLGLADAHQNAINFKLDAAEFVRDHFPSHRDGHRFDDEHQEDIVRFISKHARDLKTFLEESL